jgi:hypothetical protein
MLDQTRSFATSPASRWPVLPTQGQALLRFSQQQGREDQSRQTKPIEEGSEVGGVKCEVRNKANSHGSGRDECGGTTNAGPVVQTKPI